MLVGSQHTTPHRWSLLIWLQQSSLSNASRYQTEAQGGSRRKHIGIADEWKKVRKWWTSAHINSQLIHFSVKMEMSCLLHFRFICWMLFFKRVAKTRRGTGLIMAHRLSNMGISINTLHCTFRTWLGNLTSGGWQIRLCEKLSCQGPLCINEAINNTPLVQTSYNRRHHWGAFQRRFISVLWWPLVPVSFPRRGCVQRAAACGAPLRRWTNVSENAEGLLFFHLLTIRHEAC